MSDDTPKNDSWNDESSENDFEMDEEAIYDSDPDWDQETDVYPPEDDDLEASEGDVDASFYEPPEPPITDAELEPEEPPNDGGNWLRENWWRLAIVIVLLALIIFLLARACTGQKSEPTPTPPPPTTHAAIPTFTPTLEALPTVQQSGSQAPAGGGTETTPTAPVVQPTQTTAPPAATGKFAIGDTVVVAGTGKQKLAFRSGPGRKYELKRTIKDGVKLTVIGGPEEAGGYTWWQLKTRKGDVGWAVEDYLKPVQ